MWLSEACTAKGGAPPIIRFISILVCRTAQSKVSRENPQRENICFYTSTSARTFRTLIRRHIPMTSDTLSSRHALRILCIADASTKRVLSSRIAFFLSSFRATEDLDCSVIAAPITECGLTLEDAGTPRRRHSLKLFPQLLTCLSCGDEASLLMALLNPLRQIGEMISSGGVGDGFGISTERLAQHSQLCRVDASHYLKHIKSAAW